MRQNKKVNELTVIKMNNKILNAMITHTLK